MATHLADSPTTRAKPTREEALAIAASRKAARRARTSRIRRWIAIVSVAAFIAPFGVIYTQLANGRDPALAGSQVAKVATTTTSTPTTTSTDSSSTTASSTGSTQSSQTTTQQPTGVTTSQS